MEGKELQTKEEKEFQRFYKLSNFWISNKSKAKKLGIGALITFDILTLGYFTFRFIDYGIIDYFGERALIGSIIDVEGKIHKISEARKAESLSVTGEEVFSIGDDRVDFYAELSNPNDDWYASFKYKFTYSGGETEEQKGFILPGQQNKPIVDLAVDVSSVPRSTDLKISDIEWVRVNHHAIGEYTTWESDRLDFSYTDVVFQREVELESGTVGRTTFLVENKTPYGYWAPAFTVVLQRSGKVVGVTTATVSNFKPGESRHVVVNWFGSVPSANETRLEPNIDIFNPEVYIPIEGVAQEDVRERIKTKN